MTVTDSGVQTMSYPLPHHHPSRNPHSRRPENRRVSRAAVMTVAHDLSVIDRIETALMPLHRDRRDGGLLNWLLGR
jgi:hypothetical protein